MSPAVVFISCIDVWYPVWDFFTTLLARHSALSTAFTNVLAAFDAATGALPYALRRKSVNFIVSPDVADAYTKLLIQNGAANGLGGDANTGLVYGRYNVQVVNGLPDNTIENAFWLVILIFQYKAKLM